MGAYPSRSKITAHDRAILDLKVQRDKLHQYQKKIYVIHDKEVEMAKLALSQGNKTRALLALKKKRYQEQLLQRTSQQLLNLEELTDSIENAIVERQVFEGLKAGNDVLKALNKELSIEAVEKLMDDSAEAIAYQNEVSEMLSQHMSAEDEEEIERELDELLQMEMDSQLPSVPQSIPLSAEAEETTAPRKSTAKVSKPAAYEPAIAN